jgi:hypothetical protein
MKQLKTISLNGYSITVAELDCLQGIRQELLREEMADLVNEDDDMGIRLQKRFFYPDMIATVVERAGFEKWPISFEEFCLLPHRLTKPWREAVYELNPDLYPGSDSNQPPEEKKESILDSSSGNAGS